MKKKALAVVAALALACAGVVAAETLTTGIVSVCATASVPSTTVRIKGRTQVVQGKTDTECATTTYTIPTVTVTVPNTTTAQPPVTTTTQTTTTTPAPAADTNPVPPPANGVAFGAYVECVRTMTHYHPELPAFTGNVPWSSSCWDTFEKDAGKKLYFTMWGDPHFFDSQGQGDLNGALSYTGTRAIPVIDTDTSQTGTLADFAAGKYDAGIDADAAALKTYGHPVVVRIDAEMNGGWYAYGQEIRSSGPQVFVAAWRHIVDRFRADGATNVAFHWCPNVDPDGIYPSVASLYPGDAYVDWAGITGYDHGGYVAGGSESAEYTFGKTYADIAAVTSKPIMLGEVAATGGTTSFGSEADKVQFIHDLFANMAPGGKWSQIKAFCWFNWLIDENGVTWDWPIESSPGAQTAFQNAVAASWVVGG